MVTSTLCYGSVVWNFYKGDLILLEGVQGHATKYILNDFTSDYKTRLTTLGLLPLCYYKELNDLYFFYKCIHGFVKTWNSLPSNIRSIISLTKSIRPFKGLVLTHYSSVILNCFNVDNTCTWVSCCRCALCRPV